MSGCHRRNKSSLGETLAGEREWVQGRGRGMGELRGGRRREGHHQRRQCSRGTLVAVTRTVGGD